MYFLCFRGWSEGACFLHLLREDYRSSLKVKIFSEGGFILPLYFSVYMRAYEGYACKSLLPTNGEGGKSLEEEIILSETGINGPAFSPFIMKGYAGHLWKPHRQLWTKCKLFALGTLKNSPFSLFITKGSFFEHSFESESEEIYVAHKNDSGSGGLVQKPGPADLPDRDGHPHPAEERARPLCPGR